jgi:outer membrane immunogenic protein
VSRWRLLGAASSLIQVLTVVAAGAAELPVKAAPPPLPLTWTGFYIGANAGGGFSDKTFFDNFLPFGGPIGAVDASPRPSGWVGGLQAGYNYQIGMVVLGAEGAFSGSSLRGSYLAADGINTLTTSADYFGTLTGKVGVALGSFLLYGKGGAAWTHTNQSDFNAAESLTFTSNYWQTGWTVGGGGEYAFSPNWSVRVEYALIDTPNKSTTFTNAPTGVSFTAVMHQQINQITAGINYRF